MTTATTPSTAPAARRSPARRVLFVLHSMAIGGMETLCVDVSEEYRDRGIEVHVLLPQAPSLDPLAARFAAVGAGVHRLDTDHVVSRWAQVRNLVAFAHLCRRIRPDVVHLHTGGAAGGAGVVLLSRLVTRATVVCMEHEVMAGAKPSWRYVSIHSYHWFMRALLDRLCHGIVAVSRRNANLRKAWLDPGKKFAVTLNGVPVRDTPDELRRAQRSDIRRRLGIDPDAVVIGTLCRLAWHKGLDDLIAAFARLRPRHPSELVIVGDGPMLDELQALADSLGVGRHVHFAGYHADAKPFLSAFDVFALAVPEGTMSIALLEAMAEGLPPVITFCGPEEAVVHERTGLCAPPRDPAGLAAVLERYVAHPELRRGLGAAAAAHVRRFYSTARVADDWLEVYDTCRTGIPQRFRPESPPYPGVAITGPDGISGCC